MYGSGYCVTCWDATSERRRFGIIRDIWEHQPFKTPSCPSVFVFEVELLLVTMPPPIDRFDFSSKFLPLPVAVLSGARKWVCHLQLCPETFCMKPFDDDPSTFYILDLLA
jgi:hypothetical protein